MMQDGKGCGIIRIILIFRPGMVRCYIFSIQPDLLRRNRRLVSFHPDSAIFFKRPFLASADPEPFSFNPDGKTAPARGTDIAVKAASEAPVAVCQIFVEMSFGPFSRQHVFNSSDPSVFQIGTGELLPKGKRGIFKVRFLHCWFDIIVSRGGSAFAGLIYYILYACPHGILSTFLCTM